MNFKKWVKSIQTTGYNGARKVLAIWKAAQTAQHNLDGHPT